MFDKCRVKLKGLRGGGGGGGGGGKLSKGWHTKAAVLMFTAEFYRQPVHSHRRLAFRLQGRGRRRVASVSGRILELFLHRLYMLSKHSEELIVYIQTHTHSPFKSALTLASSTASLHISIPITWDTFCPQQCVCISGLAANNIHIITHNNVPCRHTSTNKLPVPVSWTVTYAKTKQPSGWSTILTHKYNSCPQVITTAIKWDHCPINTTSLGDRTHHAQGPGQHHTPWSWLGPARQMQ